jgi:hypothetical protein
MHVGTVDIAERDRIEGWAADTDAPNSAVEVVIIVDAREVGRVKADKFRRDLRDLGAYGDGCHGFAFRFEKPLSADKDYEVVVRHASGTEPIGKGRFRFLRESGRPETGEAGAPAEPVAVARQAPIRAGTPRYIIHIGLPKTGTKYLQHSFCTLQEKMRADGIYYPTKFWPALDIFGHHELVEQLGKTPNARVEEIFSELNASDAGTILLSCEGFIGVSREALQYLKGLIAASDVQIVFYARRWSDWIPSQWQQTIKQGATETFGEMYANTLVSARGIMAINYGLVLDKFAQVFGEDSLKVVSYSNILDRRGDVFIDFIHNVLGWNYDIAQRDDLVHESMGIFLTELIRCMNVLETARSGSSGYHIFQKFHRLRDDGQVRDDTANVFEAMRDYVAELTVDDNCYPLRQIFDDMNKRYGARLVGDGHDIGLFQGRQKSVRFVRPEFLMTEGAAPTVRRLYAATIGMGG